MADGLDTEYCDGGCMGGCLVCQAAQTLRDLAPILDDVTLIDTTLREGWVHELAENFRK